MKNMAFGLKLHKVPKDEIKRLVMEAAKILDLEKLFRSQAKGFVWWTKTACCDG